MHNTEKAQLVLRSVNQTSCHGRARSQMQSIALSPLPARLDYVSAREHHHCASGGPLETAPRPQSLREMSLAQDPV